MAKHSKSKSSKSTNKKPNGLFELRLTKLELEHLRDMFNVRLPPDLQTTVSEALAVSQGRPSIEAMMWYKVSVLCGLAGVATGEGAPDFTVSIAASPTLDVFKLNEPEQQAEDDASVFVPRFKGATK